MTPPETTPAPTLPCRHGMPPGHKCSVCDAEVSQWREWADRQGGPQGKVCARCGCPLGDGEGQVFTVCSPCWDIEHPKLPPVETPELPEGWPHYPPPAETPTPRRTPRTNEYANAVCREGIDWHYSATRMADFARGLERELAAARHELGCLRGESVTLSADLEAANATLAEIDQELYGETKVSYTPDRALTIRTIKELSAKARERLTAANAEAAHQKLYADAFECAQRSAASDSAKYFNELIAANARIAALEQSLDKIANEHRERGLGAPLGGRIAELEQQLQAALDGHKLAFDAVTEAGARELVLREALGEAADHIEETISERFPNMTPRMTEAGLLVPKLRAALTQPSPPVVRREVEA